MSDKSLLMLDVDGPLNPWAATNSKRPKMYKRYRIDGYVVWLARQHGAELNKLADVFDLVWCTAWEHQANTEIGPRIGLPRLPVIEFAGELPVQPPEPGLHWKTAVIAGYSIAHKRPFAWVDDEMGAKDMFYLAHWQPNPFLTMKIDPSVGLTDKDFASLREWAEGGMHEFDG